MTAPVSPSPTEEPTVRPADDWPTRKASPGDAWAAADTPVAGSSGAQPGIPESVGGYRLLRRLGGGGMGSVHEAEEIASGRRVAVKLLLPDITGSGEALVRFRQEGQLASAVAHPRCVFVLAADEDAGRPYIVMELMPGSTLSDLVRDGGPLPVEQAVAKILDVIDGLREAHRVGLVHRDVKPSNCFLESNGRVKIGDFGLARSLETDTKLTRTGGFVGTPLYAAPEQIHKKDPTDAQSDVYSIAATLYFLLTGRAPFQAGDDAMATMARIVSDDPPAMRSVRPELPRALDRVVLRGLERDRSRRYRDLDELRAALLVFLPAQASVGGLGLRFLAHLVDFAVLYTLGQGTAWLSYKTMSTTTAMIIGIHAVGLATYQVYYGLQEGLSGCSLGKRLLRLRVGTVAGVQPPGILRAALRAGILFVLFDFNWLVIQLVTVNLDLPNDGEELPPERMEELGPFFIFAGVMAVGWTIAAIAATLCTMRPRNGYRGLHEFLSGTRTYYLRWPQPVRRGVVGGGDFHLPLERPEGLPEQVGPFRVQGALAWSDSERLLQAEDRQLGRAVWIWMRPATEPPLGGAWRDLTRGTRLRWIASGGDGAWQWEAFVAPAGLPLPELAAGPRRLTWADVRPMLEDLAEELDVACADGTMPGRLDISQVWVQPDGHVQLLGMPMPAAASGVLSALPPKGDQDRGLQLLGETAVTALEGKLRAINDGDRVRAPLPAHASAVLAPLLGQGQRYAAVSELRQRLESSRHQPTEVDRWQRAAHLALSTLAMHIPLCGPAPVTILFASLLALFIIHDDPQLNDSGVYTAAGLIASVCFFWPIWAFLFRGGYLYWRGGIVLRRADGRKAARWQCGLRALLVWGPVGALLSLALLVAHYDPSWSWLYFGIWGLGAALLPINAILALLLPTRSLHDRLVGTYLMPS